MFDLGWPEMIVIGVIALLVIGPKDLPKVMRQVSGWVKQIRGLARQFQDGMDDMLKDSELDEARELVKTARSFNPKNQIQSILDPDDSLRKELSDEQLFPEDGETEIVRPVSLKTKPEGSGYTAQDFEDARTTAESELKAPPKKAAEKKPAAKKVTAAKAKAPKAETAPAKKATAAKAKASPAKKKTSASETASAKPKKAATKATAAKPAAKKPAARKSKSSEGPETS